MLTDFGVAKLFDMDATADLTGTGMGVGTPEYMAPEQWQGQVSAQTDVYALGVVLYEMVTGRRPYTADTPAALLIKQTNDPLPRPKNFTPGLPDTVEKIIFKALAKKIDDRYQNMTAFASALEGVIPGKPTIESRPSRRVVQETATIEEVASEPTTPIYVKPLPREKKPSRIFWLIGGGVIVLIAILAGVLRGGSATSIPTQTFAPSETISTTFLPSPTNIITATFTPNVTDNPAFTATTTLSIGSSWARPVDEMVMMYIPAGEFEMGSLEGDSDEQPVHTVKLDSYWIDQTEIKNSMFLLCLDAGGCQVNSRDGGTDKKYTLQTLPNYPTNADWEMANSYCKWVGGRLPTEAEWEKAARGGLTGKKYPWGDENPTCKKGVVNGAQYSGCPQDAIEIKSFAPNGYGLYDMAGNMWEWVSDWYDPNYYIESPSSNPQGPSSGTDHLLRGGSWFGNDPGYASWVYFYDYSLSTSNRLRHQSTMDWTPMFGFRCARPAQ